MGFPHTSWIEHWLEPVIPVHEGAAALAPGIEFGLMGREHRGVPRAGICVAITIYRQSRDRQSDLKNRFPVFIEFSKTNGTWTKSTTPFLCARFSFFPSLSGRALMSP